MVEFHLLRVVRLLLGVLPLQVVSSLGAMAGLVFHGFGIRKRNAVDNILRSDLGVDREYASRMVRSAYQNFGRTFFELLVLDKKRLRVEKFTVQKPPDFRDRIANGAILLSAHFGNWEFMGKWLAETGVPLAVVVHRQANPFIDRLINRIRTNAGCSVVYDDDSPGLIRHLRQKYCIALLADQDFGYNRTPVTFLGRACFAPEGPERLAKSWDRPVFFCHSRRVDKTAFEFIVEPIETPDINDVYHRRLEMVIRQFPDQWFWFHRRWKAKTAGGA